MGMFAFRRAKEEKEAAEKVASTSGPTLKSKRKPKSKSKPKPKPKKYGDLNSSDSGSDQCELVSNSD